MGFCTFIIFLTIGTSCQLIQGQIPSYSFRDIHFDFKRGNVPSDVLG